jgi:hypothetical protein
LGAGVVKSSGEELVLQRVAAGAATPDYVGTSGKHKARIDEFKQEGRSGAGLIVRLRLLEDALQELAARRERILKRVRTYLLPTDDHGGAGILLTGANLERRSHPLPGYRGDLRQRYPYAAQQLGRYRAHADEHRASRTFSSSARIARYANLTSCCNV